MCQSILLFAIGLNCFPENSAKTCLNNKIYSWFSTQSYCCY